MDTSYGLWALLYRDTFTTVLFEKLSEHACTFCESVLTKNFEPKYHPLVFANYYKIIILGME